MILAFGSQICICIHQIPCFLLVDPLYPLINLVNLSITPFEAINTIDKPLTVVDMINTPTPDGVRIVNSVQIIRELHLPFLHMIITLP
jgi:hypothetical protein